MSTRAESSRTAGSHGASALKRFGAGADDAPDAALRWRAAMTYEVRSGRRAVAVRSAATPHEALIEHLRSLGCRDDEIVTMGTEAVSWRGAVFSVVPAA